ncbi:hypothetical protein [Hymenobacter sp.]|uniref:hypothetical protein n=1 Tax=Hymenobacter sp. TaxID=1898978 RepID=UPI00286A2049|nr:hypothetical protein [Hymenobacter sp.]
MNFVLHHGRALGCGLAAALLLSTAPAFSQIPRNPQAGITPSTSRLHEGPLTPASQYGAAGHQGSFRLPGGRWQPAQIAGPNLPDRVRLRTEGQSDYVVYLPEEVPAYVVWGDTFVTVPAFVRRKPRRQLVAAGYVRRLYRDAGYEVLLYDASGAKATPKSSADTFAYAPAGAASGFSSSAASPPNDTEELVSNFFMGILAALIAPHANQTALLRHDGCVQELPAKRGAYRRFMLHLLADDPILCAQLRAGKFASRWEAPQLLAAYSARRREALLRVQR